MKVLHLGKYYYPFVGGIETVQKNLCEGLFKHHIVSDILVSNTCNKYSHDYVNNVEVFRVPRLFTLFSQAINLTLFSTLKSKINDYDIIHVHSPNPLAELICLFLPKHIPIVVTYHSDVVRQKFLLKFYKILLDKFLQRTNRIIVATENHIKYSFILPKYKNKCEIIPFGIAHKFNRNEIVKDYQNELKNKYGDYCIFVGRLVSYKGIDILIRAAKLANLKNKKILIIGEGPLENELQQLIDYNNLSENVVLLGKIKDNNLFSALFKSSKFLVLPSITNNENFGMVQLEAMAESKAVLTTNLKSGVPCVGIDGQTSFLVEPGNIEQLAEKIKLLFEDSERCIKMGIQGKIRFDKYFTQEKMVDDHITLYNNLLKNSNIIKFKKSA